MAEKKEKLVVCLSGGGPWGFRLQGGAGTGLPLVVSKVRRKSKAYKHLLEGDLILTVNNQSCHNLTYDQVMEIADKSGTDLSIEILRQDSNKENIRPSHPTTVDSVSQSFPVKTFENENIKKEIVSLKETNTKMSAEKEGIRIKSATLLPDVASFQPQTSFQNSFENFSSQKLSEDISKVNIGDQQTKDTFPLFSELMKETTNSSTTPIDTSTSTRTEEVQQDDNSFTKTTTEAKHEVQGNAERSFIKKEHESVSKSVLNSDSIPSITNDAKDLNDLINATQKKLESFRNNFGSPSPTPDSGLSSSIYEVKKIEEIVSETKKTEKLTNSLNQVQFPDFDAIFNTSVSNDKDLAAMNGNLGFNTNLNESSCVTEDGPFGSTIVTKKKKMFSSSSFYEEPQAIYPTVEEQVEMARKIAGSLADDTNKKSKGANMFYKRVKRSSKWIHEGPEPSDESGPGTPEIQGVEPPTPDPSQIPFRPSKGPTKLKLVMDSRPPLDLNAMRQAGLQISEHNAVSPEVCHGIVKDLQSPKGKGAALFAKRKKKSEEWVVDEEKVKNLLRERQLKSPFVSTPTSYNQYSNFSRQDVKLVKSPWEAAMENPFGLVDSAFARVNPDQLADTVIKAADNKRRNSITSPKPWEPAGVEGCMSPPISMTPAAAQYDIYHAKAPKGWIGSRPEVDYSTSFPVQPSSLPSSTMHETSTLNNFSPKKLNFQNFNTLPRLWKGSSAR